jgi:hypothetical protein
MAMAMSLIIITMLTGCLHTPTKTMDNTIVKLIPSKKAVRPGEEFTVQVEIQPASGENVAGVQFDLDFNKLSLNINSVQEGPFLKLGGGNSFFGVIKIDNDAGKVSSVYGNTFPGGHEVTQAGIFAIILCTAVNGSTTSAFALSEIIVGNKDGATLPLELITADQVVVASFADVNADGVVDLADLQAVVDVFKTTGVPGWIAADVKNDGVVNILDLILVGQNIAVV